MQMVYYNPSWSSRIINKEIFKDEYIKVDKYKESIFNENVVGKRGR
jgi:hypothetical protein